VKYEHRLWIVVMVIALHILEEYMLNFKGWALAALHLDISWELFMVTNATLILVAIGGAMIGWRVPELSLISPALILVNGIFFHLGLTLVQRRFSPGTFTSVFLFVPAALAAYIGARADGVLTKRILILSLIGGTLLMFFPLFLLLWGRRCVAT